MYKVIVKFRDLTDGHLYEAGDVFPHDGRMIPDERINSFLTGQNSASRVLIAWAEDDPPAETPKAPARAVKSRKKA